MIRRRLFIFGPGLIGWVSHAISSQETRGKNEIPELLLGSQFEIVGDLYAHEIAGNLNKRKVDWISILPLQLSGAEVLSRRLILVGSKLRVLSKRPRRWPTFLYAQDYVVEIDSITPPNGSPILLSQTRGNEGRTTALNPAIFKPL
jgi:hypothetical protein